MRIDLIIIFDSNSDSACCALPLWNGVDAVSRMLQSLLLLQSRLSLTFLMKDQEEADMQGFLLLGEQAEWEMKVSHFDGQTALY